MNKTYRWLLNEIQIWQAEGLVSEQQANALAARYDNLSPSNNWGKIIFSAIGASLIGLGVILFFAYNWEGMHRFTKLSLVFSGIILAHASGWWLSFRGTSTYSSIGRQRLGESLHLLGTILFGAGIWLIAQIYHIDEHYPNGILVWSLGALAIAWAMSSTLHALLAIALIGFWCGAEIFDFNRQLYWAPFVVGALIIPLALRKNSPLLMFFSSGLFLLLLAFNTGIHDSEILAQLMLILAVCYMTLGKLMPNLQRIELSNVLYGIGTLVYFIMLFVLTFEDLVDDLYLRTFSITAISIFVGIPALTLAGVSVKVWRSHQQLLPSLTDKLDAALKLLVVALFLAFSLLLDVPVAATVLFNIILLVHSILYLISGMEILRWQRVALGGFVLAVLIFVRFLDMFDSLLLRSASFILLGIGLFVIGVIYSRRKDRLERGNA